MCNPRRYMQVPKVDVSSKSIKFNKPLIINESNKEKIEDALNSIQSKATVRLYDIDDIFNIAKEVTQYKEKHGLSWSDLEKCRFSFDTYETMPNCYKYRISYTCINLTVLKGKIRITDIFRDDDENKRSNMHKNQAVFLTDTAKEAIVLNSKYI